MFLNESPKENSSASAGPWSLGRKFWLLVIRTTNLNSEETETERLEMERAEETGMRGDHLSYQSRKVTAGTIQMDYLNLI